MIELYDIRLVRVKALERTFGDFGVECARAHPTVREVVKQRTSNRCLADTALVRTYQYNCRFCHDATPNVVSNRGKHLPQSGTNHGKTKADIWHRAALGTEH